MQLDDHVVDDESVIYKGTLIYPDYSGSGKYYKGVSKGKGGRFYARITGLNNHSHVSVPGMYETAEEAAAERAWFKQKLERLELAMPVPKPGRVPRGTGTLPPAHVCIAITDLYCAPHMSQERLLKRSKQKGLSFSVGARRMRSNAMRGPDHCSRAQELPDRRQEEDPCPPCPLGHRSHPAQLTGCLNHSQGCWHV